jgi:hypothetical protein
MPNARRGIQEAHERFTVGVFLSELNRRHRSVYQVVAEPNPPEAIIKSGRVTRWVEVVTAFWNDAFARDLYSYATKSEVYKPVGNGVFMNMTEEFAENFASVVQKKLEKKTYKPFYEKFGQGYLVVSVQFPFFDDDARYWMERAWLKRLVQDCGYFRSVYLVYKSFNGYKLSRWQPPTR